MDLKRFHGRINDADAHLQLPLRRYPEILGPAGELIKAGAERGLAKGDVAKFFDPDREEPHTEENIWQVKGAAAPGAGSVEGRIETLDMMGIDRQLNFPQVIVCFVVWGGRGASGGPNAGQLAAMRSFNDFCIDWTRASEGRIRSVGILQVDDLDVACEEARRVTEAGISAVLLPDGRPIGGLSPAHPDVDRLWAILAEANVPALLHIGGGLDFPSTHAWGQTELLQTGGVGVGEAVGPHLLATAHQAAENYVVSMTLGGVFERVPALRFGVIELGASWVGPMVERMEMIVDMGMGKSIRAFSRRPAEFMSSNVRVTPFIVEDTGAMIDRFGLDDVYAFSTDFPHPEGGIDPLARMGASVARLGDAALERFLVRNAELLMPA